MQVGVVLLQLSVESRFLVVRITGGDELIAGIGNYEKAFEKALFLYPEDRLEMQ